MPLPRSYCTIDGCDARNVGRGLCRKHYTRWQRYGDPLHVTPPPVLVRLSTCVIAGCAKPQKSLGWCDVHYRRFKRHGDPNHLERIRNAGSPERRWWSRVNTNGPTSVPALGPCWVWTGYIGQHPKTHGYGGFAGPSGRMVRAHCWGYATFVRPVPPGLELDHLCRNRACVRFDHLEPVTHAENVRRGAVARR